MLTTDRPRPSSRRRPARPHPEPSRTQAARVASAPSKATLPRARGKPETARAARGSSYWVVVLVVGILCLAGLVMVLSASSIVSIGSYGTPWHYFVRQLIWLMLGTGGFVIASRIDHTAWRKLGRLAMFGTLGLLVAVLVPGIGVRSNGAARWLGTSSLQIQPSELAKLALIVFAADVLDRRSGRGGWGYRIGPVLAVLGALVALVMLQPDMGTSMVLVVIAVAMLFTAGLPLRHLSGFAAAGAAGAMLMAKAAPYRWSRMTSFLHPLKDSQNGGYQALQGLLAMSHGGLLGDGLGSSILAYGYLPNAQTDFIFAVICEETGMIGGFLVVSLFVTLMLVGTRIACRAPSRFGSLTAAGITAWLVGQAVINIGAVVGLLPVTGVPLPFVSFGGSALVIALFGVGILASIAKRS